MKGSRRRKIAGLIFGAVFAAFGNATFAADEASGKVVWIDVKHARLLLECPEKGCAKIPNAKQGETYTFVVPHPLKARIGALKEGQTVTVVYEDRKDQGYVITVLK